MELTKAEERVRSVAVSNKNNSAKKSYLVFLCLSFVCAIMLLKLTVFDSIFCPECNNSDSTDLVYTVQIGIIVVIITAFYGVTYRYSNIIRKMNEEIEQLKQEQK